MSLSLVSTSHAGNNLTTGGATTVTAPSSIASGNLLVAEITSGTNTITLPSGWTTYQTVASTGSSPQIIIAYKIATGSEPSTYTFTPSVSADVVLVSLFNVSGANATTPFNGLFSNTNTTASVTAGATSGTPSIPTTLGCLPISFFSIFQENLSNAGSPTSLTAGWTGEFLDILEDTANYGNTADGNGYNATYVAAGPLTSSISAAVTASCTWPGSFDNLASTNVMLFINPITYGTLAASPSSPTVAGLGTSNAVQVTITESSYTGSISISVQTASQSTVSVSTTQTGTYGTSCSITGPSASFWIQGLAGGAYNIDVLGG